MPKDQEIRGLAENYVKALRDLLKDPVDLDRLSSARSLYRALYAKAQEVLEKNRIQETPQCQKQLLETLKNGTSLHQVLNQFISSPATNLSELSDTQLLYHEIGRLLDDDLRNKLLEREHQALKEFYNQLVKKANGNLPPSAIQGNGLENIAIEAYWASKMNEHHPYLNPIMIGDNIEYLNTLIEQAKQMQAQGQTVRFQCVIDTGIHSTALDFLFDAESPKGSCVVLDSVEEVPSIMRSIAEKKINVYHMCSLMPALPDATIVMQNTWPSVKEAETDILKQLKKAKFDKKIILVAIADKPNSPPTWYAAKLTDLDEEADFFSEEKPCFGTWKPINPDAALALKLAELQKKGATGAQIPTITNKQDPETRKLVDDIDRCTNGELFSPLPPQKDKESCLYMSAAFCVEAGKCNVHELCAAEAAKTDRKEQGRIGLARQMALAAHGVYAIVPWSIMPPFILKPSQSKSFFSTHANPASPKTQHIMNKYYNAQNNTENAQFVNVVKEKVRKSFIEMMTKGTLGFLERTVFAQEIQAQPHIK